MELQGSLVRDRDRAVVGRVGAVLLDPDTLAARWLQVDLTGGVGSVVVPAAAASQFADGELLVPYDGGVIAAAGHDAAAPVTAEDARKLRAHYGFSD